MVYIFQFFNEFLICSTQKNLSHREQVSIYIDLDDVNTFDSELTELVKDNTLRYQSLFAEIIEALLPEYKEREVSLSCCCLFAHFSCTTVFFHHKKPKRKLILKTLFSSLFSKV